jgi:hypothetical protein
MEWLFQSPGGIRQAEGSVAWRHIVIEPQMIGTLTWAKTSYQSPNGLVVCNWTASKDRNQWNIDITIPNGSDAIVHLPNGTTKAVKSGIYTFKKDYSQRGGGGLCRSQGCICLFSYIKPQLRFLHLITIRP